MTLLQQITLIVLALISLAATAPTVLAQGPRLGVDADPEGNGPTQLGPNNPCVSVASGDIFNLDITISDVQELLAWEIYLEYDPAIVEIVERDVSPFQGVNPGSSVYDVSESLPDSDGLYRVAAADTADPPSPDSGSGVLARLTLKATAPGISTASLARRDLNDDGKPDLGPFLRNIDAEPIGDDDGDSFFDGPTDNAQIAVDTPCPPGSGVSGTTVRATPTDGGMRLLYILAPSLAIAIVAGLTAFAFLYQRRGRAQPH